MLRWRLVLHSQVVNLAMMSNFFAAVIGEADDANSFNTANASRFTMSLRSTSRPLFFFFFFRFFVSNSAFCEMIDVIKPFCAQIITSLFVPSIALLASSRASPILCPLRLSHPEFSSLEAWEMCAPKCN